MRTIYESCYVTYESFSRFSIEFRNVSRKLKWDSRVVGFFLMESFINIDTSRNARVSNKGELNQL